MAALLFVPFGGGGSGPPISANPPVNVTKSAASAGVSLEVSASDHKHDITTAAAGTIAVGDAAGEGAATSIARSDHRHALPAPALPAAQVVGAGTAGVATTVARADHVHPMANPVSTADGMVFVPELPHFDFGSFFPSDSVQRGYTFDVSTRVSFNTVGLSYTAGSEDVTVAIYQATDGGEGAPQLIAYGTLAAAGTVFTLNTTAVLVPGFAYLVWGADNPDLNFTAFSTLNTATATPTPIWDDTAGLRMTTFSLTAAYSVPPPATLDINDMTFDDNTLVLARGYTV